MLFFSDPLSSPARPMANDFGMPPLSAQTVAVPAHAMQWRKPRRSSPSSLRSTEIVVGAGWAGVAFVVEPAIVAIQMLRHEFAPRNRGHTLTRRQVALFPSPSGIHRGPSR